MNHHLLNTALLNKNDLYLDMKNLKPLNFSLVGCGAITQLYYAPLLARLSSSIVAKGVYVFDPDPRQVDKVTAIIGDVRVCKTIEELVASDPDAAIVASPPKFHACQTIALLQKRIAVLCEKPMCSTVEEAREMVHTADQHRALLSVGLFRRFFPVSQTLRNIIENNSLGQPLEFIVYEGGPFQWPAQSASFFQKSNSHGGVLADLGAHVLDLLLWWFGDVSELQYSDDSMGGLESNCEIQMQFANGVHGTVKLSRDIALRNCTVVRFEGGTVRFAAGESSKLILQFSGSKTSLTASVQGELQGSHYPTASWSYHQSFAAQMLHFISAVHRIHPPLVSGLDGVKSMEIIDKCYKSRKLMRLPWFDNIEQLRGEQLSEQGAT